MAIEIVWGLVGGFVATIVMTLLMAPMMRGGGPNMMSMMGAKVTGGDPASKQAMMAGMGGHFVYGTLQGVVFAVGASFLIILNPLVTGILFGLLLFIIAAVVVTPLSGAKMPGPMVAAFFVVHLIYGAVLASVAALLSGVPIV